MKKYSSIALSLAMAAALSFGVTGCGSSDDTTAEEQAVIDAITGGTTTGGTTTGGTYDLTGYGYIFIYKNIDSAYADSLTSQGQYYTNYDFHTVSSSETCASYGFTGAPYTGTDASGYGSYSMYYSSDYTRACYEYDFAGTAEGGSSNVLFYYNY